MKRSDTTQLVDHRGMLGRLLAHLKPLRGKYIFSVLCLAMLALTDTIYPLFLKEGIDRFATPRTLEGIWGFVALYAAMIALSTLIVFLSNRSWGRIWALMMNSLRKNLFSTLETLSMDYYDTMRSGWIVERFMRDVDILATFPTKFVQQRGGDAFRLAFFSIAALLLDWRMGLVLLAFVPVVALIMKGFGMLQFRRQRASCQQGSAMTAFFSETVMGIKSVKTLSAEERPTDEFYQNSRLLKKVSMGLVKLNSAYQQAIYMASCLSLAAIFTLCTNLTLNWGLSIGTLTAFISYATALYGNVVNLSSIGSRYQNCKAAMECYFSLLDQPVTVDDTPEIKARYQSEESLAALPRLKGGIEFDDVHFTYPDGQTVFQGLNLRIVPQQTIALVGETGAGKTTLVNLACRLYQPTAGRVLLDGTDYKTLPLHYIYQNLGYVLQSPHLFSGSIMDNIRYGRLDATDEEVKKAAEMVYADRFIERLAQGYGSDVGEAGSLLSSGERQLISFARAILADPAILVLDEATSSVDSETEMIIQAATARLIAGRTTFIIAHRLSTARGADRILVVDAGQVVEDGAHDQLMAAKGAYYRLNMRQFEESLLSNG